MPQTRSLRPTPSFAVAVLALVVAMGGTSYAAITLSNDSVLSKHIKNGEVRTADLRGSAVNSAKVKNGSLKAKDLADGVLGANTITVVGSATVSDGAFNDVRVDCPAGMEAVSGGIDTGNVNTGYVTSTYPVIEDHARLVAADDGQGPAATGWVGWMRNLTGSTQNFKVAVVCAP